MLWAFAIRCAGVSGASPPLAPALVTTLGTKSALSPLNEVSRTSEKDGVPCEHVCRADFVDRFGPPHHSSLLFFRFFGVLDDMFWPSMFAYTFGSIDNVSDTILIEVLIMGPRHNYHINQRKSDITSPPKSIQDQKQNQIQNQNQN